MKLAAKITKGVDIKDSTGRDRRARLKPRHFTNISLALKPFHCIMLKGYTPETKRQILSEGHHHHHTLVHLSEGPSLVKVIESESLAQLKSSGDGWWGCLHHNTDVLEHY